MTSFLLGPSAHLSHRIRLDSTSVKVFSTRNGSPHVSHVPDNGVELLLPPVELAPKSAPCPRLWRRRHMCDSHAEVATIKPRAPYRHASWRTSTKRTLPAYNKVTADEAGLQDTVEQGQPHAKLSIETSRGPRMLRPTTLDLIITPTKDQIQRTTSNFQNILVRVRAKYLDVKAQYKLLKHRREEREQFGLFKY